MKNGAKIFLGILAGVGIGVVGGILMAPDSGKKTRKKIKKELTQFEKEIDKVASQRVGEVKKELSSKVNEYKKQGEKILQKIPLMDKSLEA